MAEKTIYELQLLLAGKAEPSLKQIFDQAQKNLAGLTRSAGQMNEALKVMSRQGVSSAGALESSFARTATAARRYAGQVANALSEAGHKMHRALHPILGPLEKLGHFTGIGAGITAVGGVFAGEELARRGWDTHAQREQSRVLLDTVLQNRGLGGQSKAFNEMLLRFSCDRNNIDYNSAFQSTQMILNSGRFKGVNDVHKFLSEFADVGGTPEKSKMGIVAMSKMFSEGRIEGRHLQELASDLPQVAWYQEIAKLRNEDVGQLRKDRSKKGATIAAGILFQVLDAVAGQGGSLRGHSKAQMQTSSGEQWRLQARWDTILDKIGAIESGAVTPLISRILSDTDVQKLSDFFNTGVDA